MLPPRRFLISLLALACACGGESEIDPRTGLPVATLPSSPEPAFAGLLVAVLPPPEGAPPGILAIRLQVAPFPEGASDEAPGEIVLGLDATTAVELPIDVAGGTRYEVRVEAFDAEAFPVLNGSATTPDETLPARVDVTLMPRPPEIRNSPPTATIVAPENGTRFPEGALVEVRGQARDPEDGTDLSIFWSSDLQGPINLAPPDASGRVGFETTGFAAGTHLLTLTAVDTLGASDQDQIRFVIVP